MKMCVDEMNLLSGQQIPLPGYMAEPVKVAAVSMFIKELDETATLLIPVESPVIGMLKHCNNGMEVELTDEQWWEAWFAQIKYDGYRSIEIVEHHGPVYNMDT